MEPKKVWYIVDSKSAAPEIVGTLSELATHLAMEAREHQGHVFVVSDGMEGGDPALVAGVVENDGEAEVKHADGS